MAVWSGDHRETRRGPDRRLLPSEQEVEEA